MLPWSVTSPIEKNRVAKKTVNKLTEIKRKRKVQNHVQRKKHL